MSATASQASQKPLPKVLRIGVAQDGKIVQEKVLKVGEVVSVGENPKNSFVITGTKLPPKFDLFVPKGDSYQLVVPDWIEGKISWKDGIRGLDELRARGEAVKKGDLYTYQLNENVRGKVNIGTATLLFQFVPAPPEPVRAVTAADFRPKFFDDEDPLFQGLLGVFSLVAAAFMAWVYTTPVSEKVDLDALADAADLVVERKIERIEIVEQTPDQGPQKTEEKKPDKPKEEKAESKPKAAESGAPDKQSVAKKSVLLQLIGTTGSTNGANAVEDLLGDDAAVMAGLDAALQGVSGVQQADAASLAGAKGSSGGGREDAKVGIGIAGGGDGKVGTTAAAVKVKKPVVESGSADADVAEGDAGNIASVVRKSQGRITSCLEQSLKLNQNTSGRVSVGWNIQAGRVTDVRLVQNTTGDDALGKCIVNAVRAFRFDPGLTAEVAEFPWVVSGQ